MITRILKYTHYTNTVLNTVTKTTTIQNLEED